MQLHGQLFHWILLGCRRRMPQIASEDDRPPSYLEHGTKRIKGWRAVGSLDIPVSRHYTEDCKKEASFIQCEGRMTNLENGTTFPQQPRSLVYNAAQRTSSQPSSNLPRLWGLTANLRRNHLFYTDRGSHEVTCVHPTGKSLFKFGQNSASQGKLFRPAGIAYDNEHGILLVADKDHHRICFFTTDGQYISSFGTLGHGNGMFYYPWDLAVSPNGQHIAVADSRNKRVQLLDRFGNYLSKYSVYERNPFEYKNEFDHPRGITFDETGKNIYVTYFNVDNVLCNPLNLSHHRQMIPIGHLRSPQGITVDWAGNLLVADTRNHSSHLTTERSHLQHHTRSQPTTGLS